MAEQRRLATEDVCDLDTVRNHFRAIDPEGGVLSDTAIYRLALRLLAERIENERDTLLAAAILVDGWEHGY